MSIIIIACGKTGVTLKAAKKLGELIGGEVEVTENAKIDLSSYDTVVLGTNVRYGKFDKRFNRLARSLKKSNKKVFAFICGAEIEKEKQHLSLARETLPFAKEIVHVWGEINLEGKSAVTKFILESFLDGRKKDGLPKPRLLDKQIVALAKSITENK